MSVHITKQIMKPTDINRITKQLPIALHPSTPPPPKQSKVRSGGFGKKAIPKSHPATKHRGRVEGRGMEQRELGGWEGSVR